MDLQRLLLLFLLWSQSEATVVNSVSDCAQFFLDNKPPKIPGILENGVIKDRNRYKAICQICCSQERFFTLYDTQNKIPVFSAYIFNGNKDNSKRPGSWRTEPQLKSEQATDNDYINANPYERGHLYPNACGCSSEDKKSTFTLTNVVPQATTFNQGSWKRMESDVQGVMRQDCRDNNDRIQAYLVTGAEPGNQLLNGKINIPKMMWSAFCCYSSRKNKWLAGAHWGDNVPQQTREGNLPKKTLTELYTQLGVQLFPANKCS